MELPQGVTFADLADEHGQPTAVARQLMAEGRSLDVKLDSPLSPLGFPWLEKDSVEVRIQVDRGTRSILYEICNRMQVRPSDFIQALIVWVTGRFISEEDGSIDLVMSDPYIRCLVHRAASGAADWDLDGGETPEEYVQDWLMFFAVVWSKEWYQEHASYKLALQPRHNMWLRRLAKQRGVSKAKLMSDVIEALAVRDLGVELSEEPESSQE